MRGLTPTIVCCGCSQEFTLTYTSDWLEEGIVARWISCPHCPSRFVLAYKHEYGKIITVEPVATSLIEDLKNEY